MTDNDTGKHVKFNLSNNVADIFMLPPSEWLKGASIANIKEEEKENVDVSVYDNCTTTIEIYKPIVTRITMSKYEFVHTLTSVAKFLYSNKTLEKYCDVIEINSIINPAELAFKLLMNRRLNAVIDRLGYEKVTFSELLVNPEWVDTLEVYFKQRHENENNEVLKPFGLL